MKRNLRIDEAAELLSCSRSTIYRMIEEGQLSAFRIRTALRVPLESIEEFRSRQILQHREEIGMGE